MSMRSRPSLPPALRSQRSGGCCAQADGVLQTWVNGTDPCTDAWYGISCNCSDIGPFVMEARHAGPLHTPEYHHSLMLS